MRCFGAAWFSLVFWWLMYLTMFFLCVGGQDRFFKDFQDVSDLSTFMRRITMKGG